MTESDTPLRTWYHDDGRQIVVYADRKIRRYYFQTRQDAARNLGESPFADEWRILWRRDVPNLTDEQWLDVPAETGWKGQL